MKISKGGIIAFDEALNKNNKSEGAMMNFIIVIRRATTKIK